MVILPINWPRALYYLPGLYHRPGFYFANMTASYFAIMAWQYWLCGFIVQGIF